MPSVVARIYSPLSNPDKTRLLLLGTSQMLACMPKDFSITLLGKKIRPSHSAKDLFVVVDPHLSFNEHVTDVENFFNYCSSVWASTTKKHIVRFQKVQNFAARVDTGITPIFKHARQLKVRDAVTAFKNLCTD